MNWIRKNIYWIASILTGGLILWLVATAVSAHSVRIQPVGTLFGRPVPETDYLKALQAATHQAMLSHGDRFRKEVSAEQLEQQAWERLLLLWEAQRKGVRVSDQEVVAELQSSPLFRDREGRFDTQGYQAVMQYALGTTPRVFEEELREEIMIQKMVREAIGSTATPTEEEIKKRYEEKTKEKPGLKDFESSRSDIEKELVVRKRLQNYMAWYQELLKRAQPQKKAGGPGGGQAGP